MPPNACLVQWVQNMHDPLNRLYRTKTALMCVLLVAIGIGLIVADTALVHQPRLQVLMYLPWPELGGTLIGAGLLSVLLDHFLRREKQAVDNEAVSTLGLIPSTRPTLTERSPEASLIRTVRVGIDGWVFPRSGAAFVWTRSRGGEGGASVQRSA